MECLLQFHHTPHSLESAGSMVDSSLMGQAFHCDNSCKKDDCPSKGGTPKRRIHSITRFKLEWTKKHPCIVEDRCDSNKAQCKLCSKSFYITHQGNRDEERHLNSILHTTRSRDILLQPKKTDCFTSHKHSCTVSSNVNIAEVKFTAFLSDLLTVADHAGLYSTPCSLTVKYVARCYRCDRTKTTSIVNGAFATDFTDQIVKMIQTRQFSLCLDDSNDQEE